MVKNVEKRRYDGKKFRKTVKKLSTLSTNCKKALKYVEKE